MGVDEEYEAGTLSPSEYHPAADMAMGWLKGYMVEHPIEYLVSKEALASNALSGNRLAEVCTGTIQRLAAGEPVSDRYLLGLAWVMMWAHHKDEMEETARHRIDR